MDANTVSAVADLTGVSVRTLHHYDHIGLVPSVRTPAGYRGYTDADIERLQHTIKAVEELMNAHRKGIQLTAEEQVEVFGTTAFGEEYAAQAEERWGETDAWKQSQQRVSQFSKQDWIAIKAEGDALLEALAQAKRDGVPPGSAQANDLAARHRAPIDRFYDCGDEMHRNLVEMYLADERFTRYYDDVEPGLAQFVHDIVIASIDR
jgi:DNA-binding transcriptional MerR regulator